MFQFKHWLVPTKNFDIYSDKPPLLFWTINAVWAVTGVSEFAGRLVVPVSACLAIWLTAKLAVKLWPDNEGVGGRAAMALMGLSVLTLFANLTMFDVPLAVAVLAGLLSLSWIGSGNRWDRGLWPWCAFGASIALGVVTKGPVILFHLLPAAVLLPFWTGKVSWQRQVLGIAFALLVALIIVSLWLLPAILTGGPEYRDAILWHQTANRFSESFAHARPWWFYFAVLPVLIFPLGWSSTLWRQAALANWRGDGGLRLCAIWFVGAFALFSLTSGKQIHYLVPELPAVALVAARLTRSAAQPLNYLTAVIVLCLAAVAALLASTGLVPLGELAQIVEPRIWLVAWSSVVLALCWFALRRGNLATPAILTLGSLFATNVLIGTTQIGQAYDTTTIGKRLGAEQQNGIAVLSSSYHAEFNFTGRLTVPVDTLGDSSIRDWVNQHPRGVIVGRVDRSDVFWSPSDTVIFRNRPYGIWHAADAP